MDSKIYQKEQSEWNSGIPNQGMTCYFNSAIQLFIHCLDLVKWNLYLDPQIQTHNSLRELKKASSLREIGQITSSLNNYLNYMNKQTGRANDPVRVISAMLEDSMKGNLIKPIKAELPKKLQEDWIYWTESSSELSELFLTIFYQGYWCDKCNKSELVDEERKFIINLSGIKIAQGSIQKQIEQMSNKLDINWNKLKCPTCTNAREKINGFLKLPKFLYVNLDINLMNSFKIEETIQFKDQISNKHVSYSLQGFVNHPPGHYTYVRKNQNGTWKEFNDSFVSKNYDSSNNFSKKGLLYMKNEVMNYDTLSQKPMEESKKFNFQQQQQEQIQGEQTNQATTSGKYNGATISTQMMNQIPQQKITFSQKQYDELVKSFFFSIIKFEEIQNCLSFLNSKGYCIQGVQKIGKIGAIIKAKNEKDEDVLIRLFSCSDDEIENFKKEAELIKKIKSKFITPLICFEIIFSRKKTLNNLILFVENEIGGETLFSIFQQKQSLNEVERFGVLKGIFEGFKELQNSNITFGNLNKHKSILRFNNDQIILNGYGLMDIDCEYYQRILRGNSHIIQSAKSELLKQDYYGFLDLFNKLNQNHKGIEYLKSQINYYEKNKVNNIIDDAISKIKPSQMVKPQQMVNFSFQLGHKKSINNIYLNKSLSYLIQYILQEKIIKQNDEEVKEIKFQLKILDRFKFQIDTLKNVSALDMIGEIKKKIQVFNHKRHVLLLDQFNNKLDDNKSLSNYNITKDSSLIAFEVDEQNKKNYLIYKKDTNSLQYYCTFKAKATDTIQEVKQDLKFQLNYPIEKQELFLSSSEIISQKNSAFLASCITQQNRLYLKII